MTLILRRFDIPLDEWKTFQKGVLYGSFAKLDGIRNERLTIRCTLKNN